ncbi:MAG: nitrile hydratase subunit beta [Beijerinckiaceae bacterium]|nr:nitrile hydratase subunit beta [Beijerinckiaceae bacterium]
MRFSGRDLWGEQADKKDYVHIDMWESYIDAV